MGKVNIGRKAGHPLLVTTDFIEIVPMEGRLMPWRLSNRVHVMWCGCTMWMHVMYCTHAFIHVLTCNVHVLSCTTAAVRTRQTSVPYRLTEARILDCMRGSLGNSTPPLVSQLIRYLGIVAVTVDSIPTTYNAAHIVIELWPARLGQKLREILGVNNVSERLFEGRSFISEVMVLNLGVTRELSLG